MRIRLRAPAGSSTITLAENATIQDLTTQIATQTGIQKFDIRYGYPPQPLLLQEDQKDTLVRDLDVKLDGEQLTIGSKDEPVAAAPAVYKEAVAGGSGVKREKDDKKLLALKKKAMEGDVPEIPMPERGATLVLRVMPDDNSCLFRAFATAVLPDLDSTMHELRSLVATYIQSDPQKYTKVVLEKEPSEYCRWIQREESWGGAIEMQILAEHYEVEICSIDVKSGQPYRFNTTAPNRCILVYSGIHYDTVVQSPSEPPHTSASLTPPEFDRRIWESEDEEIISRAQELCARLKAKNYYTDTGSMAIRCNTCGWVGNGQMEASRHFQDTMHVDMAEVE